MGSDGKSITRLAALLLVAAIACRAAAAPVWHLDTWSHWAYGRWIVDNGCLPSFDPFSYTAEPGPLLDSAWLSQVLCYRAFAAGGVAAIACFYACVETLKALLYLTAFRRAAGSLAWAVVGLFVVVVGRWTYFDVFRPQTLGEICWAVLLVAAARPPWPRWAVAVIPLIIGLWANLHGAFLLGVGVLALLLVGRWRDAGTGRLALTFALSVAATALTPHGPAYLATVARFGRTASLGYVAEWQPLAPLSTFGSYALVMSFVVTLATLRRSLRQFRFDEHLLLAAFGLAAWFARRMLPFWMTLCPLVLLPHWRALWEALPARFGHPLIARLALLASAGAAAASIALSDLRVENRLRPETPVAIARELRRSAAAGRAPGRVFCSAVWGDYLAWEMPAGDRLYWYSHWHCFSPRRMYEGNRLLQLRGDPDGWQAILQRHRCNVLAIHNDEDSRPLFDYLLAQAGQPDSEWAVIVFRDPADAGIDTAPTTTSAWGLLAYRRIDPFTLMLAGAQLGQVGVGAAGQAPLASIVAVLGDLPWRWPDP